MAIGVDGSACAGAAAAGSGIVGRPQTTTVR
jgi:hypothetical protein